MGLSRLYFHTSAPLTIKPVGVCVCVGVCVWVCVWVCGCVCVTVTEDADLPEKLKGFCT